MITNLQINHNKASLIGDCSFGNRLFRIAGIIGIATKKGYTFGFPKWNNQEFFVNPLPPSANRKFNKINIKPSYRNYDFGFCGFNYPDDRNIEGEFGSWKYFEHCKDLVKHYFTMIPQCEPYKDCILIHYRDYKGNKAWNNLNRDYYIKALKELPKKRIIVVTDNIPKAAINVGLDCEYTSNTPIIDFYLLANADYLIMANSTFSWWGSYLSGAITVAPKDWYSGVLKDAPTNDLYLPNWIKI